MEIIISYFFLQPLTKKGAPLTRDAGKRRLYVKRVKPVLGKF